MPEGRKGEIMFIVRYPNGQEIKYNGANFLLYSKEKWEIYTKEGGLWIASIQPSPGVIVEAQVACSVSNPLEANLDKIRSLQSTLADRDGQIQHLKRVIAGMKGARKK